MQYSLPSIDEDNPFYCPSVSAAAYLKLLHRKGKSHIQKNKRSPVLQSFTRLLDRALTADVKEISDEEPNKRYFLRTDIKKNERFRINANSSDDDLPGFSYPVPAWEHDNDESPKSTENFWIGMRGRPLPTEETSRPSNSKRKRTSFSDIRGPPKYARSIQSEHDSSFDISVKHEKLSYSVIPGSPVGLSYSTSKLNPGLRVKRTGDVDSALALQIRDLEDQLYGPRIGTESPRGIAPFIERLDLLVPGIRLKERLSHLPKVSHQSIMDFLANNGHLNARILAMFRSSEIQRILLTESLLDANGLNLCGRDVLNVFSKPNSFLFLSELSLSGTRLSCFDLIHIQRLPKLSTLLLDNTAVSNEAVFLLIPLKYTLTQLSLASNPAINDDAVPALLLLSELSFLSILDTGINMPGLRRLARTIYDDDRIIDIEIPTACEDYIDNMHKKYLLYPRPPLITNPKVCSQLSSAALQRNLAAHAMKNSNIVAAGGKAEMAERLRTLLEVRKMDVLVRDMILGSEEHNTG